MELTVISRLIGNSIKRKVLSHKSSQELLGVRFCSSNSDTSIDEEKETLYNRRGGKTGNYNKYYASEKAFTFDSHSQQRFHNSRPGEYYSFESFMDRGNSRQSYEFISTLKEIDWSAMDLPPMKRDLYKEPEIVRDRSTYEVESFRDSNDLKIKGDDIPNPILHFSDYQFPKNIQKVLEAQGFKCPMPIQSQTWPVALQGRDLISIGQTGSGKTLGFLLPAVVSAFNQTRIEGNGPACVILAPTRELVQQINSVLVKYTENMNIKTVCLFGGVRKESQIEELMAEPLMCVSTPGRLRDMLELKITTLENCCYFVLDEADRMLDMGFEPQIRSVLSQIRPDHQTLMWSATWPEEIQSLASEFLDEPIHINVGSSELCANPNINQQIIITDNIGKIGICRDLINEELQQPNSKILIFVETKKMASVLNMRLQRKNIACSDLHGDHDQLMRNRVINAFRKGVIKVVIATDVASRGLDVSDISLVLNYAMPREIETYIHRIGRTARAGKSGKSISLFTNDDKKLATALIGILRQSNQKVPQQLYIYNRSK